MRLMQIFLPSFQLVINMSMLLWEEGEVEILASRDGPRALGVNLLLSYSHPAWLSHSSLSVLVVPLPPILMYASYLNPIYLLWMTDNNSCC